VTGWEQVFSNVEPHDHYVQFYDEDALLAARVAQFFAKGWKSGEALITVATAGHNRAIIQELDALGIDTGAGERVRLLDAHEMLEFLLVDGQPDRARFDRHVGTVIREYQARCGKVRVFGEMVGLLFSRDRLPTALRIEEYWSRVVATCPASLFCAYPIDLLARQFDASAVAAILRSHTHLLPFGPDGNLAGALEKAMDEVLGIGAQRLRKLVSRYFRPSWAAVPDAESMVLWIRANLPQYAERILSLARRYYHADGEARATVQ
jgi:hypothetical protein